MHRLLTQEHQARLGRSQRPRSQPTHTGTQEGQPSQQGEPGSFRLKGKLQETHRPHKEGDQDARPPVLSAWSPAEPRLRTRDRICRRITFRVGPVLLSNGENVQGDTAGLGHHELVHFREVCKQSRRDDGVGKQEQQGSVVVVIVRRGVGTASLHCTTRGDLTLNLAPH